MIQELKPYPAYRPTQAVWLRAAPAGSVAIRHDYDREYTVDLAQLLAFLVETQPTEFEGLNLTDDGPSRRKFLARLQGELSKRGIIDVLRNGVKDGPHHIDLLCSIS